MTTALSRSANIFVNISALPRAVPQVEWIHRRRDCTFCHILATVENLLALPNGGRRYYLVQDFEPSFTRDPHHTLRAENTYRAGLSLHYAGAMVSKDVTGTVPCTADHFDFAVDTNIYWPRPGFACSPSVCFYARSRTPRRAYELGLEALQLVKTRLPRRKLCSMERRNSRPAIVFFF